MNRSRTTSAGGEERVLVTGGAGFIGSHLCEALVARGARVTALDNLSTGRRANLRRLRGQPRFRLVEGSAADRRLVNREVARHDLVYHLASAVGVRLLYEEPVEALQTTFQTTAVVLAACSRHGRPVLLTSSSEVYGKTARLPFTEDEDVTIGPTERPRWSYGCVKAADEFLALAYARQRGLPVFIARLFNTVGPRQSDRYGMVLPRFVRQALAGEPLTVYGDGRQRRCFCAVQDVVRGLLALPACEAARGRVVNLGGDREVSVRQLAERVRRVCQSRSEIRLVPYEAAYGPGFDDMHRRVPSLARARTWLGWEPQVGLDDIVAQVARDAAARRKRHR